MELAGLDPSSCHATAGGIPFGNIPVLSLTATSTILQGVFQSLSTKGSTFPVTTETHLTSSMMPLTLSKSSSKEISSSEARYTSGPPAPGTEAATTADPLQFPTQGNTLPASGHATQGGCPKRPPGPIITLGGLPFTPSGP